jgi:hypothetical protein
LAELRFDQLIERVRNVALEVGKRLEQRPPALAFRNPLLLQQILQDRNHKKRVAT